MALALDLSTLRSRQTREGAQTGAITVSLIWNDPSDLDLHAYITRNGQTNTEHLFYGHKKVAGGYLDVDMNYRETGKAFSLEPVENIFWKAAPGGKYRICVRNAGMKTHPTKWDGKFTDNNRSVPFKVFLERNGEAEEFEGEWSQGKNEIEAFTFEVEGSGAVAGTGGGGRYIVFPPEDNKTTFKELCAKHEVPWAIGGGFYAVAKKEKIQAGKEMLLQCLANDNFTIGGQKCRDMLEWPAGEVNKGPGDVLEGHRLFVQSTSANRVIPPGTHVLFEVDDATYFKFNKTSTIEADASTTGTAGMSAAAKAAAKAKAKADAAAKAAAEAEAEAEAAPAEISVNDQHEFLNLARDYKWADVKSQVEARPHIINVQPLQRWSALHQACGAGDDDMVRWLLDAKASVDAKEKDGKTPLEVVKGSSAEAIKAMLKASTASTVISNKRKATEDPEPKAKAKAKVEPKAKSKATATTMPQRGSISGKNVVFSGTMEWSRPFAVMKAEAAGATVLLQVGSTMDVLIAGPDSGNKSVKAEKLGKVIWDEDMFKAAL